VLDRHQESFEELAILTGCGLRSISLQLRKGQGPTIELKGVIHRLSRLTLRRH
jgi:hypothetical protein